MIPFIKNARKCKLVHSDRKQNDWLGMGAEVRNGGRDAKEQENSGR